jgi:ABC-type nickel/cobalt efflux system permease component RcnA
MNASKMMAKITTTNQKKNTTMPGMAYPATVLALATTASYPQPFDLFGDETPGILVVSEQTDEAHLHAVWLKYRSGCSVHHTRWQPAIHRQRHTRQALTAYVPMGARCCA